MNQENTYDVIVVGAGAIGCSIAYHLAQAGLKTALFERAQVGAGASGACFGEVQSNDVELKHTIPMVKASYARFDHLEEELGMPFGFRRKKTMRLLLTEADWKASEERGKALTAAGIHYEYIPPERIRELEPMVDPHQQFYGATYCNYQGQLMPQYFMWAYVRRAIQMGLALHTYTPVTGFDIQNGRMRGVRTSRGNFSAGTVILCTAAWTRQLGKLIGRDWKIQAFRASSMVTEPVYDQKFNTILNAADHIEMEVTGPDDAELTVLAICQTLDGHFLLAQADRPGDSTESSISHVAPKAMAIMAARYFPVLRTARILRTWTAPTTFTDDGCPLIGPVPGIDGLILAASYRSGIVHAPLAGEIMTQLVTLGRCDLLDLGPFAPEREMQQAETIYQVKRTYMITQYEE